MAWSLVQKSASQATGGTCTLPVNATAGNLLVLIATNGTATALTPPSGFSTVKSTANGTTSETYVMVSFNTAGGASSFAVTGGSGAIQCEVMEFTCPGVSSVAAVSDSGTQTGGAVTNITVATGGTALVGDLVVVGALQHVTTAAAVTWTDPSGFDGEAATTLSTASASNHGYGAYRLSAPSSGAQSVIVTSSLTGSSTGWTGVVVTFTQPSAAVAVAAPRQRPALPVRAPGRARLGARAALAAGILAAGIGPPRVSPPHQPPVITHPAPHRGAWRGSGPGSPPNARQQAHTAPKFAQRVPHRAVTGHAYGSAPNAAQQVKAPVPVTVYARPAHRGQWRVIAGPVPVPPSLGAAQPFAPKTVYARKQHGAVWKAAAGRPPAPVAQPFRPLTVFRRTAHAATWRAGRGSPAPPGPAFTVGALTAAAAATATQAPTQAAGSALTAGTAPASTLTAGTQRTGGPA